MNYAELQGVVQAAALTISNHDGSVHTVGLSSERGRLALRVLRTPALRAQGAVLPESFEGLPVRVEEALGPPVPLYKVPGASAQVATLPEQAQQRPLALGLQIQNVDHDVREGTVSNGYRTVGTPCCFAPREGEAALLSNNHVLAGENGARPGDRVQQPGALEMVPEGVVAELSAFVPLVFTSEGQLGMASGVNVVDAAVARLAVGVDFTQA